MSPKEKQAFAAKMKAARAAKRRRKTAPKAKVAKAAQRAARKVQRTARRAKRVARRAAAPKAIVVTANAQHLKAVKVNPGKRRRKLRRNPGMGGFLADVTGSFSELKSLTTPQGMLFAGAGAASAAVLGSIVAPQVAKMVPAMSQPLARGLNTATYAVAGLAPALLVKDSSKRRKFILGALGVAISEGIFPGWTADVLRKVPGISNLIPTPPVTKRLADAEATLEGLDGLGAFGRRPIGGYFAAAVKPSPKGKRLSNDLIPQPSTAPYISAGQALPLAEDLIDRPGSLASDLIDRPGALAGMSLGAF